ncbi:MAG: hypothetical protein ACE5GL_09375, partial [Calditrichia bacterium]
MLKLKTILYQYPEFEKLGELLNLDRPLLLKGIYGSLLALVITYIRELNGKPQLIIVPDSDLAEKLTDDLQNLMAAGEVCYFPCDEVMPFDEGIFTPALYSMRMKALTVAVEKNSPVVITTPQAILKKVPSPRSIKKNILHLKAGEDFERELLIDWLAESGFERVNTIDEVGQFSVRGGIVDIFSFESDVPFRLEFFGDTVESIREFDVITQLSTGQVEKIRLLGETPGEKQEATLLDYFPENSLLFWEDYRRCEIKINEWWEDATATFSRKKADLNLTSPDEYYLPPGEYLKNLTMFRQVKHCHLQTAEKVDLNFSSTPPPVFHGNIKLFVRHISDNTSVNQSAVKLDIYLLHESRAARDRLQDILEAEMGHISGIKFIAGEFHNGFCLPQ